MGQRCEMIAASPQGQYREGSCLRNATAGLEYLARKSLSVSLEGAKSQKMIC
jgi:hypothetical protein